MRSSRLSSWIVGGRRLASVALWVVLWTGLVGLGCLGQASLSRAQSSSESSDAAVSPRERTWVQVKGSDTIGEHLGRALVRVYAVEQPAAAAVRWESLGSSTGFVGLFDDSADLCASSRSVRENELEQARALGITLREFVIGYDGIAVITHPSNPVRALSLEQLGALFRGEIDDWEEVGGRAGPVRIVSRPSYSGTHGFFRDTVLRRQPVHAASEFAVGTRFVEETDDVLRIVAMEPDALSYVGLGFVAGRVDSGENAIASPGPTADADRDAPRVRVLAVSEKENDRPVLPDRDTVRDGSYPVYRPLYLYAKTRLRAPVRDFLAFVLSSAGQAQVVAHGFVPRDVAGDVAAEGMDDLPDVGAGAEAPVRIYFGFAQTALDRAAMRALDAVHERLNESTRTGDAERIVEIVGHTDSVGDRAINGIVSQQRAAAAAAYLENLGVPRSRIRVAARAFDEPIATNDGPSGRSRNRRVDVRLVADPGGR